jgi:hypothetical protein
MTHWTSYCSVSFSKIFLGDQSYECGSSMQCYWDSVPLCHQRLMCWMLRPQLYLYHIVYTRLLLSVPLGRIRQSVCHGQHGQLQEEWAESGSQSLLCILCACCSLWSFLMAVHYFIIFVASCHDWFGGCLVSSLVQFGCSQITAASSFTNWLVLPVNLTGIMVFLRFIWCSVIMLCFATAHLYGQYSSMCHRCLYTF